MMLSIKNKWFIISSGLAPIYKSPTFNSDTFQKPYTVSHVKLLLHDKWLYVQCEDGYKGWVNKFYGYQSNTKNDYSYIIAYPNNKGFFNAKYPFGAKLTKKRTGSISIDDQLNYDNILKILNNLIGIPYKWGGRHHWVLIAQVWCNLLCRYLVYKSLEIQKINGNF